MPGVETPAMVWTLTCACGERVVAASEEDVVAAAELHVAERHPALAARTLSRDLLAMAEPGDPDVDLL